MISSLDKPFTPIFFVDGISLELHLGKETFDKHNLEFLSFNKYGWKTYTFGYYKDLKLKHQEEQNIIRIAGSLPYFLNGQNLYVMPGDTRKAIQLISELIGVDIRKAEVKNFEYGVVIPRNEPNARTIYNKHLAIDDFIVRTYENGKYFINPQLWIKLYDAKASLQKKVRKLIKDELKRTGNYDPSKTYIKFEVKYKDPTFYFKRTIKVYELLSADFKQQLQKDIKYHYSQIKVTKTPILPADKSEITLLLLAYFELKEFEELTGHSIFERLENRIRSIDSKFLSRQNKHNRSKTLRELEKKSNNAHMVVFNLFE
jgi:hypothetical protein